MRGWGWRVVGDVVVMGGGVVVSSVRGWGVSSRGWVVVVVCERGLLTWEGGSVWARGGGEVR